MVWQLFRLKELFERVSQLAQRQQEQDGQLIQHCEKTQRAFRRFRKDQRRSERQLRKQEQRLRQLTAQVERLLPESSHAEPTSETSHTGETSVTNTVQESTLSMPSQSAPLHDVSYEALTQADTPSWKTFQVILQSLTPDEWKLVQTLWMEARPLTYQDLRRLQGKRTIHAVKKHIHNLQAKGFPLMSTRAANGAKRYYLSKQVVALLKQLSQESKKSRTVQKTSDSSHPKAVARRSSRKKRNSISSGSDNRGH